MLSTPQENDRQRVPDDDLKTILREMTCAGWNRCRDRSLTLTNNWHLQTLMVNEVQRPLAPKTRSNSDDIEVHLRRRRSFTVFFASLSVDWR